MLFVFLHNETRANQIYMIFEELLIYPIYSILLIAFLTQDNLQMQIKLHDHTNIDYLLVNNKMIFRNMGNYWISRIQVYTLTSPKLIELISSDIEGIDIDFDSIGFGWY
ncbi:hypothetical protein ACJX0J_026046 [Zea mays]